MPFKTGIPILLLALFSAVVAEAQLCRVSVAGLNRDRRVFGGVNVECPGGVHSAPFGNWGVTSNYGSKVDGRQFEGWCRNQNFNDNLGSLGRCADNWFEWNSCTDNGRFQAPNCSLYNAENCTEQVTTTGINVIGTREIDVPVGCPQDSDNDGFYDRGGCLDLGEFSNGDNFMTLYELDPVTTDDLVQTLIYPATPATPNCDIWGCPQTASEWVEPVAYDSPPWPPRATAEFQMLVNFATFIDPNGRCALRPGPLTTVSAASYNGTSIAAGSIASIFGANLGGSTEAANELPLPSSLGGVRVRIADSSGFRRVATLLYVSPGQINFVAPLGLRYGEVSVEVEGVNGARRAEGKVQVGQVSPGLFSANADGKGVAAAFLATNMPDGGQKFQLAFTCQTGSGCRAAPIRLDQGADPTLVLFGTGMRLISDLATVSATVGGEPAVVAYAGLQGEFIGLDQVNLLLPRALIGRGEVEIRLRVDGKDANMVSVMLE